MPLSKPLLPGEYVQDVLSNSMMVDFKSYIYNTDSHEFRIGMRNWMKPLSPDCPFALQDEEDGFTREANRTYLHFHAKEGDVLSVSELITFGATPSMADSDGHTPLHLVGHQMVMVKNPLIPILKVDGSGFTNKKREYARLAWVLRILVEQHADVNIVIDGDSLLDLSCSWMDWDIISLLLKHGATPSPGSASRFKLSTQRKRFSDLVKSFEGSTRPARICPCWSGKTVPECHGKSPLPYQLKYMCVCGSTKTYERCCHKRGKFVSEKWDPVSQRNLMAYDDTRPILPVVQHELASDLLKKGMIDPAFAYAMGKTEFLPMPHTRATSRTIREDMQTIWNRHIDDYIAQGNDSRSREKIERAAKIRSSNGALYRVCKGNECKKVESDEVKFSVCSKCKISAYCSRSCQKSSWPLHKTICGSEEEQALPSQVALKKCSQQAFTKLAGMVSLMNQLKYHLRMNDDPDVLASNMAAASKLCSN